MLRSFQQALTAVALCAAMCSQSTHAAEELCSLPSATYTTARSSYPASSFALAELEKYSIATWYTDRSGDYASTVKQLVSTCSEDSRLSLVVYGIPNKDCEAGYSASGSTVQSESDYLAFLSTLTTTVGNRKALYVLEPDAVGLLSKEGGCGEAAGYRSNLKLAIKQLSANPNAEIYLDVGYWTLMSSTSLSRVTEVIKELAEVGTVKGITINTSNYRSNKELSELCTNFQVAMESTAYKCIVDTSRNYNEPTSTEWCNVRSAGIGHPPTSETGFSNLDYFMWVKPPGESDGTCDGSHDSEAMQGPAAGKFFDGAFSLLWNQGYFVKELGMAKIGDDAAPTPAPTTTAPETPSPASTSPVQEYPTPEPTTASPVTITPTPAPTTASPVTITPDLPTPAPTTMSPIESPINGPTPAPTTPLPTPASTPCIYQMAGATPTPMPTSTPATTAPTASSTSGSAISDENISMMPLPAPIVEPYPEPTPAATQTSADGTSSTNVDFDIDEDDASTSSSGVPTPAPTSLRGVVSDADTVAIEHESSSSGDIKQVSTSSSSSGTGTTAGILAVFVVIGVVAAIAAYMNSRAKKKALEEPKSTTPVTTSRACEAQSGTYLSVL